MQAKPTKQPWQIEHYGLTPREKSILRLLVLGNTQKQIAQALAISPHTVTNHLRTIYAKMGVHSRTQAQLIAITQLGMQGLKQ